MTRRLLRGLVVAAVTAGGLAVATPAHAAPSCIARSVQSEHALYGSAWGHDVAAYLASHPAVLQEFGFRSFGELARFAASQDPDACPADL